MYPSNVAPVLTSVAAPPPAPSEPLLGDSEPMRALRIQVRNAARSHATVLITGETGSGKGVVARAIHASSPRAHAPLVHVDCAALAGGTIESELFGHERGAFTGAHAARSGRLETAAAGSLFLDEVGELEPRLQAKFLRLLQERTFERVGGNRTQTLRARVLAATNRDLEHEIRAGRFRADLYYRLHVLHIRVPPLRERTQDLARLAVHACARIGHELGRAPVRLSDDFLFELRRHAWPGNVRELWNVLERCLVASDTSYLTPRDLREALRPGPAPVSASFAPVRLEGTSPLPMAETRRALHPRRERDRQRILDTLRETGGNVSRAARRLAMSRSTLRHRIHAYGLAGSIPRD